MSQLPNQSLTPQQKEPSWLVSALKALKGIALRNWGAKLFALVIAVALWVGLITQDPDLTREKNFRDVPVSVTGADTLKRRGYIVVSDLDKLLDNVELTVDVPQMEYGNVQAENYNARIDLSTINRAGKHEVRILTDNASTPGYDAKLNGLVTSVSPGTVSVTVEEYVTRGYIPVNIVLQGEAPEGFYADVDNATKDPKYITVSGPKSQVDRIRRAEVVIRAEELFAQEDPAAENNYTFTLMDAAGNVVSSDMLEVTRESVLITRVNVKIPVYTMRDIPLLDAEMGGKMLYVGKPAEGYEVAEVLVNPSYVTIAGKKSIVESVSRFAATKQLSIVGATETVTGMIDLGVPVNLAFLSADQATVTVVIRPKTATASIADVPVQVEQISEGMTVLVEPAAVNVSVTGAQTWVQALTAEQIRISCDASGLGEGTHELPLGCIIQGSEGQEFTVELSQLTVRINLTAASAE